MTENIYSIHSSDESIVIPQGYEPVVVPVDGINEVVAKCPNCGGSSFHTSAQCDYCNTSRTHYEYRRIDEPEKKKRKSTNKATVLPKTRIDDGSFEGNVRAVSIDVGSGSVVGNLIAKEYVYLNSDSKVGFVFSPVVRSDADVEVSHLATTNLDTGGSLEAKSIRIYNGGTLELHMGSHIDTLYLGEGVEEPNFLVRTGIKEIVHGDYPRPTVWNKD